MKKIKRYLFIFFLLLMFAFLSWLVWQQFIYVAKASKYVAEKVKYGDVAQTVSANGTLNPVILVNVGTQITGIVQKIYADFNDRVTEGQILLELDTKLLRAELAQSLAQVKRAKAALDLAIANEKRGAPLRKQNYISKQDWEKLVEARRVAVADLELAKAIYARDQTNLDYATIRSPVSGVIVDREVDVGQTVTASFQTPILFTIAQDLRKMQIDSSYAEADIGNIRSGQKVTFSVDAFPNRNFFGIVKQIRLNPTTQQNVVTYNVVVTVDNPEQILLPGMTAYVNIKTLEHKNVLLVPNSALRYRLKDEVSKKDGLRGKPGYGVVYKLVDNRPVSINCRLGITDNRYTEVISDQLKPGDNVITGDIEAGEPASSRSFRMRVF